MSHQYNIYVETLINIFTVEQSKFKILLIRKKEEPYKGYWILPGNILNSQETLEDNVSDVIYDKVGLPSMYVEQCHTFSSLNRDPNARIIATSFIGLIDSTTVGLHREERPNIETSWFPINDLPKLGYDHEEIIKRAIEFLKKKVVSSNVLTSLFPSDFTLPELQRVYEQILNKEFDRRNFRKKFINLGLIEDTGDKNEGSSGRPAKLYRFKEDVKEYTLF